MADQLSNWVDAMNRIPDNSSNLISPQDTREMWLSATVDRGGAYFATPPGTIPITVAGEWVDIPSALGGDPAIVGVDAPLFWRTNLNGASLWDYAADWPTVTIPPGLFRYIRLSGIASVELASNSNVYEFAFTVDGVPIAPFSQVEEGQNQDVVTLGLDAATNLEVITAPVISMAVRNLDGTADLDVTAWGYAIAGGPHA